MPHASQRTRGLIGQWSAHHAALIVPSTPRVELCHQGALRWHAAEVKMYAVPECRGWIRARRVAITVALVLAMLPPLPRSLAQSHVQTLASVGVTRSFSWHAGPRFDPRTCPDDLIVPNALDQTAVSCGSVTVPQDRSDPGAKLARVVLPVVVYAAPSARNRTPLVFLAGGPGEPAIEVVSQIFLATPAGQVIVRERPVIAFNQRGFGDDTTATIPTLGELAYRPRATRVESVKSISDTARSVAKRLRARGVDPRFFTT